MRTDSKIIFSKFSQPVSDGGEARKISYWLEKLFNQEKRRNEKTEREQTSTKQSAINSNTNTVVNPLAPHIQEAEQDTEIKGIEESIKNHAEKAETDRHKLEDMVASSNRILISISSVFPLDIFPTSIDVEETRITVIHRQLFSSQAYSLEMKDISNVLIDQGFFFAVITIVSRTFTVNEIKITNLWKKDAVFVRRVIEGLRMFN